MSLRVVVQNLLIAGSLAGMSGALYAGDCGTAPTEPEIPDGASVNQDELVQTSEAVKQYIDDADAYLDCKEKVAQDEEAMKSMSKEERAALKQEYSELAERRNSIGDEFNAEVEEFRKANMPEE